MIPIALASIDGVTTPSPPTQPAYQTGSRSRRREGRRRHTPSSARTLASTVDPLFRSCTTTSRSPSRTTRISCGGSRRTLQPYRLLVASRARVLDAGRAAAARRPGDDATRHRHRASSRRLGMVWESRADLGGSLLLAFACQYGETMLTQLLGQRVMRDLRRQIFEHVQRLPVVYFDRNPVGRTVTRVTSDVESLNELFTAGVVAGLGDLFTLVAISALMLATDWRLARLPRSWSSRSSRLAPASFSEGARSYRDIRTRVARINAYLQERITGMRVAAALRPGREPRRGRSTAESGDLSTPTSLDHLLRAVFSRHRGADVRSRWRV